MAQFQCVKCVMDRSDPDIVFNEHGVCNYCLAYDINERNRVRETYRLNELLNLIKKDGGKVLIGLSGGVDSSMVLDMAIHLGLKPITFTVDNGWNNPIADRNIEKLIKKTNVPYTKQVLDMEKFKELQSTFVKSGVSNIEIPSDHCLMAASLEFANNNGIKWILSGGNIATENTMPYSWGYQARDLRFMKAVYKKITGKKLTGVPMCSLPMFNYYRWIKGIKTVYLLDFFTYNRNEAVSYLTREYGYEEYGEKHCESVWTQWFQNFFLFEKFGFDKRKAHLSSLIHSAQVTREYVLEVLKNSPEYPRLGIEQVVMRYPKHSYKEYPNSEFWWNFNSKVIRNIRKLIDKNRFNNVV